MGVDALYVFWTAPYRARGIDLSQIDLLSWFERFFLALSVETWRLHSGKATMVTDSTGAAILARWGLTELWSEIDTATLDNAPQDIDAAVFWDTGKTLALAKCKLPVALLDLDLIVWKPLEPSAASHFFHWEEVERPWYPSKDELVIRPGYKFPDVDWTRRAGNTALMYLADPKFRDMFVAESLSYSRGNSVGGNDALASILFSSQRLFAMLGHDEGIGAVPFVPYVFSPIAAPHSIEFGVPGGDPLAPHNFMRGALITHLWGYKHELRRDDAKLRRFCVALMDHARSVAPDVVGRLVDLFCVSEPRCTNYLTAAD